MNAWPNDILRLVFNKCLRNWFVLEWTNLSGFCLAGCLLSNSRFDRPAGFVRDWFGRSVNRFSAALIALILRQWVMIEDVLKKKFPARILFRRLHMQR